MTGLLHMYKYVTLLNIWVSQVDGCWPFTFFFKDSKVFFFTLGYMLVSKCRLYTYV
jgi:hypothetical protein